MFVVYSKENCMYCTRAKLLLDTKGYDYEEIHAPSNIDALKERINIATNGTVIPKTVPQIFVDDHYIGGYTELVEYFEKNKGLET